MYKRIFEKLKATVSVSASVFANYIYICIRIYKLSVFEYSNQQNFEYEFKYKRTISDPFASIIEEILAMLLGPKFV